MMADSLVLDQRNIIRSLKREFKKYLNPVPILDHVSSIGDEVAERIQECQHRADGVDILIDYVVDVQDENMTLSLFISALSENGYQRFVEPIEGKNRTDHISLEEFEFLIHVMRGDMIRLLKTSEIVPELISRGCLSDEDKEAIECKRHELGDMSACREMFNRLPRRKPDWAWQFFDALKETDHSLLISKANLAATDEELEQKGIIISGNRRVRVYQSERDDNIANDNREHEGHDSDDEERVTMLYHYGQADVDNADAYRHGHRHGDVDTSDVAIANDKYGSSSSENEYYDSDYEKADVESSEKCQKNFNAPKLQLRNYQHELARKALTGVNTIICADTGSGKTWVCLYIVQEHLKQATERKKVVFMAKTNPLVQQQCQIFEHHLPEHKVCHISRDSSITDPIEHLLQYYDIFFMTPQILVNHLEAGHVTITSFSMLIFDECHHMAKGEQYNTIMRNYIRVKHRFPELKLPQIIGMTDSIGIGKATTEDDTVPNMLNICANMDVDELSTVDEYRDEMRKYVPVPSEEHVKMTDRHIDQCYRAINEVMLKIEECIKHAFREHYQVMDIESISMPIGTLWGNKPPDRQSKHYQKWCGDLKNRVICDVSDMKSSREINTSVSYLLRYYDALEVNYLMNIEHVLEYLEDKFRTELDQERKMTEYEKRLLQLYKELKRDLHMFSRAEGFANPNVDLVLGILQRIFGDRGGVSRGIVFVETRATAFALAKFLNSQLRDLDITVKPFTGTKSKENIDGMTEEEKKKLLEMFKAGDVKLLVATSVGSEGIDVPECNIVLKCNYAGNEINIIQMRGRSRKRGGSPIYIGDQFTMHKGFKDKALIKTYLDAMEEGREKSRNIRIMLLGDVSVGKTSFGRNIMEDPLDDIQSTNGIDILNAYMVIDLDSNERKKRGTGQEKNIALEKIGRAVNSAKDVRENLSQTTNEELSAHSLGENNITSEQLEIDELINNKPKKIPKGKEKSKVSAKVWKMEDLDDDRSQIRHEKNKEEYKASAKFKGEVQHGKTAYVSLWDFAGESTFYATHHVFLTADAIYVILYDLLKCLLDEKEHFGTVIKWLESVAAYCDSIPPVLLIGTHLDQLQGSAEEKLLKAKDISDKLEGRICKIRKKWPYLQSFCISNTIPDPEIWSEIWKSMLEAATYQSQWEREMPTKWLSLEHKLMSMRASGTNVLNLGDVCKLNRELESPIGNLHMLKRVLMFLHNCGFILYVRDEEMPESLNEIVIINPPWIVNAFRCIITSPKFRGRTIDWKNFEQTAKLSEDLIECAWQGVFIEHKLLLIKVMQVLGLLTTQMNDETAIPAQNYYIVPSFLPEPDLKRIDEAIKLHTLSSAFVFNFCDNIVPRHVFDHLLAKIISKYDPLFLDEDDCFCRGFGIFRIPGRNLGFVVHCEKSAIKLTLEKIHGTFSKGEGFYIRKSISEWLQQIMSTADFSKLWEKHVDSLHCKWYVEKRQKFTPIADIELESQPCCELSSEPHTLTLDHLAPWVEKVQQAETTITLADSGNYKNNYETNIPTTVTHGISTARTTKFRKANDDTQRALLSDIKAKCNRSVGLICSPETRGTGFRIGTNYILTCWHVVEPIITEPLGIAVATSNINIHRLERPDVFIQFGYKRIHHYDMNKRFAFSASIPYFNTSLDVVILELKEDGKVVPPKIAHFRTPSPVDDIFFIGHPNGEPMMEDPGIKILEKNDDIKQKIRDLNDWYRQRSGIDEYLPLLETEKLIFDCRFQFGASGSLGMIVEDGCEEPVVVIMLQGGVPSSYLESKQQSTQPPPDEHLKEFGIGMDTLYNDMKANPTLDHLLLDVFGIKS